MRADGWRVRHAIRTASHAIRLFSFSYGHDESRHADSGRHISRARQLSKNASAISRLRRRIAFDMSESILMRHTPSLAYFRFSR